MTQALQQLVLAELYRTKADDLDAATSQRLTAEAIRCADLCLESFEKIFSTKPMLWDQKIKVPSGIAIPEGINSYGNALERCQYIRDVSVRAQRLATEKARVEEAYRLLSFASYSLQSATREDFKEKKVEAINALERCASEVTSAIEARPELEDAQVGPLNLTAPAVGEACRAKIDEARAMSAPIEAPAPPLVVAQTETTVVNDAEQPAQPVPAPEPPPPLVAEPAPAPEPKPEPIDPQALSDLYARGAERAKKAESLAKKRSKYASLDAEVAYLLAVEDFEAVVQGFEHLQGSGTDIASLEVKYGRMMLTGQDLLDKSALRAERALAKQRKVHKKAAVEAVSWTKRLANKVSGGRAVVLAERGAPIGFEEADDLPSANDRPDLIAASSFWRYSRDGCFTVVRFDGDEISSTQTDPPGCH